MSQTTGAALLAGGILAVASVCQPAAAQSADVAAVYRYYRLSTVDHFYTPHFSELGCGGGGYAYEGVVGYLPNAALSATVALNRFWDSSSQIHFYSIGSAPAGYTYEGIVGYIFAGAVPGSVPLYQMHHTQRPGYLYSTDPAEVGGFPPNTYVLDGVVGYVYAGPPGGGAPCVSTVTISEPTDGTHKQLVDADLTSASVRVMATVPGAYVDWTLNTTYTTSGGKGPLLDQQATTTVGYGVPSDVVFTGVGGKVTVHAKCAQTAVSPVCDVDRTITIAGPDGGIPSAAITSNLNDLYLGGATPNLLTGIAMRESSYRQFALRTLYGVTAAWPLESAADGGSHIGLMMMPWTSGMESAFSWSQNTAMGAAFFVNEKLPLALTRENQIRATKPGLRALTDVEREHMAVVLYGPYASSLLTKQYYVPICVAGKGSGCNGGTWAWAVNTSGNPQGVTYANEVWSLRR